MATELYTKEEYCLANDKLDRGKQADLLVKYIESIDKSFVMNINSPFGTGKSFFLGLLEEKLEAKNNYKVVNINAWENDDQNPAMIFLAEIYSIFREEKAENELVIVEKAINFGKGIIKNGSKLGVSLFFEKYFSSETAKKMRETLDVENLSFKDFFKVFEESLVEKKDLFKSEIEDYIKRKESREKFKEELEKLTQNKKLIIMIDDLDRCKPTFALELLETVKHIFDITGIIFILATDFEQLKHTVSRVYGEIENEGYLKRFIDREFKLVNFKEAAFVRELIVKNSLDNTENLLQLWIKNLLDYPKVSLRTKEKIAFLMGEYKRVEDNQERNFAGMLLIFLKVAYPKEYKSYNGESVDKLELFIENPEDLPIVEGYYSIYKELITNFCEFHSKEYNIEKKDIYKGLRGYNLKSNLDYTELVNKIEFLTE